MKTQLEIPEYSPQDGFRMEYVEGFRIQTAVQNGENFIRANRAGLVSLASWIMTLAQPTVPDEYYFDVDTWSGLDAGSTRMSVCKLPTVQEEA